MNMMRNIFGQRQAIAINTSCYFSTVNETSALKIRANHRKNQIPILQVSEVFKSVQGEGPFTGRPSVFLRLGICNLSCVWCDTAYTWSFCQKRHDDIRARVAASANPGVNLPKLFDKSVELNRIPVNEITEQIFNLAGNSVRNVVITGGEPLIHKKPLLPVVHQLLGSGFTVEFETNGTISPNGLPSGVHLNVSPKLSNSIQPYHLRVNLPVINQCISFQSSVLKFVVDNVQDMGEVLDIVKAVGIEPRRVFLMPQGSVSSSKISIYLTKASHDTP